MNGHPANGQTGTRRPSTGVSVEITTTLLLVALASPVVAVPLGIAVRVFRWTVGS